MKRIVLVKTNSIGQYFCSDLKAVESPLWLATIARYYDIFGYEPIILDAEVENLDVIETLNNIINYKPDEVLILASGNHPSSFVQQQESMYELEKLLDMEGINVKTYNYLPISPLKFKPMWELINHNKYIAHNWQCLGGLNRKPYGVIYTSISCPYSCNFCNVKKFYVNNYETRNIDDIIDDFDELVTKYNITNFKIMDELFCLSDTRVQQICDKLANKDYAKDLNIWSYARIDTVTPDLLKIMRKAGIRWVAYGIESGNESIRQEISKGKFSNDKIKEVINMTKDYGINIIGNYMFGFWNDNYDTMQQTLDLAVDLNCEFANFYCLVAYPDSKLYKEMEALEVDVKRESTEYAQMSEFFNPLPTKYLHQSEVLQFRDNAFSTYFCNSSYLNMIDNKFGVKGLEEIKQMNKVSIKRDLLQ